MLDGLPAGARHPGLLLDKYLTPAGKQERQKDELAKVVAATGDPELMMELAERRDRLMETVGATSWTRATLAPLTLGLARAATPENAGITLHPIHGFAYLPGTGLKGMARAYAETVWLPGRADPARDWAAIERIFGWAPGSDRVGGRPKPWKPPAATDPERPAAAGSVVFHDAWPASWPRLTIDIVNSHHPEYYRGEGPPGDWDSPVPVYFLAIPAGQQFRFAIGPRRPGDDRDDAALARQWLDGGLGHLGFGAKTAAGYGYFDAEGGAAGPAPIASRAERSVMLEAITPAFLAGAEQREGDCGLRPATLRGQLRCWWRTMHAGFLDRGQLLALEGALWGDTEAGATIQTVLAPRRPANVRLFNYKDGYDPRAEFKRDHQLGDRPDNKTTQGLFYAAYGMDEKSGGQPRRRFYQEPGGSWMLRLVARDSSRLPGVAREQALDQALASLWLLCHFGAVGSKARKGFGSLQAAGEALAGLDLGRCRTLAHEFRTGLGLPDSFDPARLHSSSLERSESLGPAPLPTPWTDPWQAMDRLGFAYQEFAQRHKHDPAKASLGLPRKIHGPSDDRAMPGQRDWRPPVWLGFLQPDGRSRADRDARYASPVHIHVGRPEGGTLTVQAIAFAAPGLPDLDRSRSFLGDFLAHLRSDLSRHSGPATTGGGASPGRGHASNSPRVGPPKRDHGTPVLVKILAPKGTGFRVAEEGKPEGSLTVGKPPAPPPAEGAVVPAEIHNDDPKHPQYRWPDPGARKKGPPPRGPGRPRR